MALLKQDSLDILKYRGWFGSCGSCEEIEIADYVGLIQTITQYVTTESDETGRTATAGVRSVNTSMPSWSWDFTKFECGYIYQIDMKRGDGNIELRDFIVSEHQDGGNGLLTNSCGAEPTPTPISDPVELQFRCEVVDGNQVLQIKNNLNPTHSNFVNRDTSTNFSTVYHFNPVHSLITNEQHNLNDPFWPSVSVNSNYTSKFKEKVCCEPKLNSFDVTEGGITNITNGTLNSFIYGGTICMSDAVGSTPNTIYLEVENYNYPIGKIDVYGELTSNEIYFHVTENSQNQYFPDDLLDKCFKGTLSGNKCEMVEDSSVSDYSSFMFEHRFIEIKKYAETYSRVFVDGQPVYMFVGDNDSPATSATGNSSQYPVVLCGDLTPTPTPTPTQVLEPTPTPIAIPEFRWKQIGEHEILQVRNIFKPSHSNFLSRDTINTWSTVYAFDGTHSSYNLSDSFWPDASTLVFDKSNVEFDGVVISYGEEETDVISGQKYYQLMVTLTEMTEFSNDVSLSQPSHLFIYFGDNTNPEESASGQTNSWPSIRKKIMETPTPTPSPPPYDCCNQMTKILAGSSAVASILFEADSQYTLCCKPKMNYTDILGEVYEFGVKLNGGDYMAVIKIVARIGGISSSTFDTTIFKITDSTGNCYTADLGGLTGGEINFTSE